MCHYTFSEEYSIMYCLNGDFFYQVFNLLLLSGLTYNGSQNNRLKFTTELGVYLGWNWKITSLSVESDTQMRSELTGALSMPQTPWHGKTSLNQSSYQKIWSMPKHLFSSFTGFSFRHKLFICQWTEQTFPLQNGVHFKAMVSVANGLMESSKNWIIPCKINQISI